jgi:hypothetical protein
MLQWVGAGPLVGVRSNEVPVNMRKATNPLATVETNEGVIVLELLPEKAPNHVANFMELAERGFCKRAQAGTASCRGSSFSRDARRATVPATRATRSPPSSMTLRS